MRDLPGATFKFNKAAMCPGHTYIEIGIKRADLEPEGDDLAESGAHMRVDDKKIFFSDSDAYMGINVKSDDAGVAEVLKEVTRRANHYRQIPKVMI